MGNWDTIYQQYNHGGDAWATLSEGIDHRCIELIEQTPFIQKRALDIGCGTGKYLLFLQNHGFIVDGIDSSPTAVEMTKKIAGNTSTIQQADMYDFSYPQNTYDLILSVSTLHHGRKSQVHNTILRIYESLILDGKVFITLPNLDVRNTGETFKDHTEIEPGTYSPLSGPEEGIPHSFFTEQEILKLFSQYQNVSLDLDEIGRWFIVANK